MNKIPTNLYLFLSLLPLDKSFKAINTIVDISKPHELEKYKIILVINEYVKYHNLQKGKIIVLNQPLKKLFHCSTITNIEQSIERLYSVKIGYINPEHLLHDYAYDNDLTLICYIHKSGGYCDTDNYTPYGNLCIKVNTFEKLCDNIIKVMHKNDAQITDDYFFDEIICEHGNIQMEIYSWQEITVVNVDQNIIETDGKEEEIRNYIINNYKTIK